MAIRSLVIYPDFFCVMCFDDDFKWLGVTYKSKVHWQKLLLVFELLNSWQFIDEKTLRGIILQKNRRIWRFLCKGPSCFFFKGIKELFWDFSHDIAKQEEPKKDPESGFQRKTTPQQDRVTDFQFAHCNVYLAFFWGNGVMVIFLKDNHRSNIVRN